MADKYLGLNSGKTTQTEGQVTSAGGADAGKIPALDGSGRLDPSLMPVGVAPDTKSIVASENLTAGDYVNIWNDGGTEKARKADNSNGRDAHGFVLASVTAAASGQVYFEGPNTGLSGLTIGGRYYLGTSGAATATPLDNNDVANSGKIHQMLGVAIDDSQINTDIADCITL